MAEGIRVLSYLPNPRVWKALIAADLCGVEVDVVGDEPKAMPEWLWDYDARRLAPEERTETHPDRRQGRRGFRGALYKTDAFLRAHPFGTVPAAFGGDGSVGIFESNSILRTVARLGAGQRPLYGQGPLEASRIDSFLDATLVFGREAQVYLLSLAEPDPATHARMVAAYEFFADGIEAALGEGPFIATDELSIADIAFVCEMLQTLRDRNARDRLEREGLAPVTAQFEQHYPNCLAHLRTLLAREEFARYAGPLADEVLPER